MAAHRKNLAADFFLSLPSKVVVRLCRLMMYKVCFFSAHHKRSCFLLWLVFGRHIQYILTGSNKHLHNIILQYIHININRRGVQICYATNSLGQQICWEFFFGVTMFWQTNLQPTSLDNNLFWLTTCPTIFLGRQRLSNQHSFLPQFFWIRHMKHRDIY